VYVYKTKGDKTARMRVPRKWYALNKETCDQLLTEALRSRG
jgi:hypothetical protein